MLVIFVVLCGPDLRPPCETGAAHGTVLAVIGRLRFGR